VKGYEHDDQLPARWKPSRGYSDLGNYIGLIDLMVNVDVI